MKGGWLCRVAVRYGLPVASYSSSISLSDHSFTQHKQKKDQGNPLGTHSLLDLRYVCPWFLKTSTQSNCMLTFSQQNVVVSPPTSYSIAFIIYIERGKQKNRHLRTGRQTRPTCFTSKKSLSIYTAIRGRSAHISQFYINNTLHSHINIYTHTYRKENTACKGQRRIKNMMGKDGT